MRGTVCTGGEGYGARKLGGGGRIAAVGMVHPPVHGGSKEVASRTWQLNEIQQVLKYILAVYDLINTRQTTNFLIASSVYWISNFAWYELRLRYFTKEFNLSYSWCNSRNISAIYSMTQCGSHLNPTSFRQQVSIFPFTLMSREQSETYDNHSKWHSLIRTAGLQIFIFPSSLFYKFILFNESSGIWRISSLQLDSMYTWSDWLATCPFLPSSEGRGNKSGNSVYSYPPPYKYFIFV